MPKQKICYYHIEEGYFRWGKEPLCPNTTECLMAIANGCTVTSHNLDKFRFDNVITDEELNSILLFDRSLGNEKDLEILKPLAKKLKVKLCLKK